MFHFTRATFFLLIATLLFMPLPLQAAVSPSSLDSQIEAVSKAQKEAEQNEELLHRKYLRQKEVLAQKKLEKEKQAELYKQEMQSLDIEERKLRLQAMKKRVDRSDDYIDRELQQQDAQTDVIKSQADSNRNVSKGIKSFLEKAADD